MRRLVLALVASGCVHNIPLTPQEQCATSGMIADGFVATSAGSYGVATGGGTTVYSGANAYGQSVSCRRANGADEQVEVAKAQAAAEIKLDWSPFPRNLVIFVGYFVFVIPGIVASVGFISEERGVEADARAAYR